MISYLNGEVINKKENFLILLVGDIGYKVFVSKKVSDNVKIGNRQALYIYQQVGEQVLALYGVFSFNELSFFDLLISVSGIGPKTALGVLDIASIPEMQASILEGSADLLSQASGICKKTAERVVLELRTKLSKLKLEFGGSEVVSTLASEEIDALMALGYSMLESRDSLRKISASSSNSQDRIKEALKILSVKQ